MNKPYRDCGLLFCTLLLAVSLCACMSNTSYAPVVNAWQQPAAKLGTYLVRKGDTVYSIAWAFGLDYRALAAANDLHSPYEIRPGQRLRMTTQPHRAITHAHAPQAVIPGRVYSPESERVVKVYAAKKKHWAKQKINKRVHQAWASRPVSHWQWPARGRVIQGFSNTLAGNKGINIAGRLGEPVRAAAGGQVVYSGDGVRGYGNLLIIKHNDSYLSAYAYNKRLLVKLGDWVRPGQEIAEMGRNNAGRVLLHFEIRRNGKPVNPMKYLRA